MHDRVLRPGVHKARQVSLGNPLSDEALLMANASRLVSPLVGCDPENIYFSSVFEILDAMTWPTFLLSPKVGWYIVWCCSRAA